MNYGIGTSSKGNQTQPSGGCNPGAMGGGSCMPQGTASLGCGTMGAGTPCSSPTDPSGGCAIPGIAMPDSGSSTCPPQGMPSGIPDCGGGSSCVTVDTGCVQTGSQPMGGAPCAPPDQGTTVGCPGMGNEALSGTSCVIQGKLVEGCPNVTTGENPCPPTGTGTGGCVNPVGPCTQGTNGTTTGPNPPPGPNPKPGPNGTKTGPNPKPGSNGTTTGPNPPATSEKL